jgi:hypothetical protein
MDGGPHRQRRQEMKSTDQFASRREFSMKTARAPEPNLTDSLEQLLASSQNVVTKRIDLALLEGSEIITRSIRQLAMLSAAVAMVTGMWFALVAAVVEFVLPQASLAARLAAFAGINAAGAVAFLLLAKHQFDTPILARHDPRHQAHAPARGAGGT